MEATMLRKKWIAVLLLINLFFLPAKGVMAWSEHPLITYPVAGTIPEVINSQDIVVESLESFIISEEKKLETLLAEEEFWAKKNLQWYAPLPASLVFIANGKSEEVLLRFSQAIRVNPIARFPLYLQLIPGVAMEGKTSINRREITFLKDTSDWSETTFVQLKPGDKVRPLDVITSASDEPDLLGIDIGLFEDNKTQFSKNYQFGSQPFGNPNLEYSSQSPFHLGFYHEAEIMYILAGFLKKTYPEYRINLYKKLAQLAFQTGHPYWGWRFTGWGLHYIEDLAQPYHATALPGVSTPEAIWINTLEVIGFHSAKANAIQLVSNRHVALEKFTQIILRRTYKEIGKEKIIKMALEKVKETPVYEDSIPRNIISRMAHDKSGEIDEKLRKYMPKKFVSDPKFELGTSAEREQIVEMIKKEKGQIAVDQLTADADDLLTPFVVYGRSYIFTIIKNITIQKAE